MVKGTENGDNVVCNGLALLKRLSHDGCFFTQQISSNHCYSHLLVCLVRVVICFRKRKITKMKETTRQVMLLLVEFFDLVVAVSVML